MARSPNGAARTVKKLPHSSCDSNAPPGCRKRTRWGRDDYLSSDKDEPRIARSTAGMLSLREVAFPLATAGFAGLVSASGVSLVPRSAAALAARRTAFARLCALRRWSGSGRYTRRSFRRKKLLLVYFPIYQSKNNTPQEAGHCTILLWWIYRRASCYKCFLVEFLFL